MSKYFNEINELILSGEVENALLKLIEFSDLNKIDCSDAKSLKAQYAILNKKINLGVIENDWNTSLNRIISSIIECSKRIEDEFFDSSNWISTEIEFLDNEIFPHMRETLTEYNRSTELDWFFDDHLKFTIVDHKYDDQYWYIIHWKLAIFNPVITTMSFTPKGMFVKRKDQDKEFGVNDFSLTSIIKERLVETVNFFGAPFFDIEVDSNHLYNNGFGYFIEYSSAIYPNRLKRSHYRWKTPSLI